MYAQDWNDKFACKEGVYGDKVSFYHDIFRCCIVTKSTNCRVYILTPPFIISLVILVIGLKS